jgi:hypothetical protein
MERVRKGLIPKELKGGRGPKSAQDFENKGDDGSRTQLRKERANVGALKRLDVLSAPTYPGNSDGYQNKALANWAVRNRLKGKRFRKCGKTRAVRKWLKIRDSGEWRVTRGE